MTNQTSPSEVDVASLAPESAALIDRFALALKEKMRAAEMKHGWRTEWQATNWSDRCWNDLVRHLGKGDPRDVAIYAAFMWHHGWNTRQSLPQGDEAWSPDEICDEAVRLADAQPGDQNALWRAAYHGAMLTRAALVRSKPDDVREALIEALAEMLACSLTGGVHFAVEPEPSSVDTSFALRNEAHAMSAILTAIHPTDEEGCFVHKRPVSAERLQEIIALADRYREARTAIGSQSIEGERG